MRAEVVAMDAEHLNMEAIQKAGKILKEGGLVAFPTETVYGLGGNALDPAASMKIYAAKGILKIWQGSRQRFRRVHRSLRRNTGRDR